MVLISGPTCGIIKLKMSIKQSKKRKRSAYWKEYILRPGVRERKRLWECQPHIKERRKAYWLAHGKKPSTKLRKQLWERENKEKRREQKRKYYLARKKQKNPELAQESPIFTDRGVK